MAAASEPTDEFMRCGFCLRENANMKAPKLLPCKHIHCWRCLDEALDVNKIAVCPDCKQPINEDIQDLPDAAVDSRQPQEFCDACKKSKEPAVVYCTDESCKKKFCRKHKEYHDDLSADHKIIVIQQYHQQKRKEDNTTCSRHRGLPLTLGCRKCPAIICERCWDEEDGCNGSPHETVRIKKLYNEARNAIYDLTKKMEGKKDELSALTKESDRTLTQHDQETEEMLRILHTARDDQIQAINKRYADVEKEFVQKRKETAAEIVKFRDEVVEEELSQLNISLQRVAAALNNDHMVHLIRKSNDMKRELKDAIERPLLTAATTKPTAVIDISGTHEEINASISLTRSEIEAVDEAPTDVQQCPSCGVAADGYYCNNCGQCPSIGQYCGSCGALPTISESYCYNCNAYLPGGEVCFLTCGAYPPDVAGYRRNCGGNRYSTQYCRSCGTMVV